MKSSFSCRNVLSNALAVSIALGGQFSRNDTSAMLTSEKAKKALLYGGALVTAFLAGGVGGYGISKIRKDNCTKFNDNIQRLYDSKKVTNDALFSMVQEGIDQFLLLKTIAFDHHDVDEFLEILSNVLMEDSFKCFGKKVKVDEFEIRHLKAYLNVFRVLVPADTERKALCECLQAIANVNTAFDRYFGRENTISKETAIERLSELVAKDEADQIKDDVHDLAGKLGFETTLAENAVVDFVENVYKSAVVKEFEAMDGLLKNVKMDEPLRDRILGALIGPRQRCPFKGRRISPCFTSIIPHLITNVSDSNHDGVLNSNHDGTPNSDSNSDHDDVSNSDFNSDNDDTPNSDHDDVSNSDFNSDNDDATNSDSDSDFEL